VLPGVVGEVPPGLLEPLPLPGVDEVDPDPELGADEGPLLDPLAVPGNVPHGDPLGEVPGFVGVFGLMVDGWVVLPGVGAPGVVDPGTLVFGVPLGEPVPGVGAGVCGTGGPACGVAGEPGVEVCPALLELPAGAPLAGAVCATTQLTELKTTDNNVNFVFDMSNLSAFSSFLMTNLPNAVAFSR